jgi:hypothetical protein
MKITTHLLIATLTAISFTACGNDSIEGFNGNSYEEIAIDINCSTLDTIDKYIILKSGDQIIKDEEDSNITIFHDENGVKSICLQSGKAHINRANEE